MDLDDVEARVSGHLLEGILLHEGELHRKQALPEGSSQTGTEPPCQCARHTGEELSLVGITHTLKQL